MKKALLPFVLVLTHCVNVLGSNETGITITRQGVSPPIGTSVAYFTDTTGEMPLASVLRTGVFLQSDNAIPRFGLTRSAHWLRFDLTNLTSEPELAISLPYPGIDRLNVFLDTGTGYHLIAKSGLTQLDPKHTPAGGDQLFTIPVPPGERGTVLIQISGFKHLHAPILTGTTAAMSRAATGHQVALGVYIGIMLVLFLYNIFVYTSTRDKNYLFYVLSILALSCTQLTLMGYGPFNHWHISGWLTSRSGLVFNLIAIPLGYEFARGFMHTRHYAPRMDRWIPVIYLAIALIGITYVLFDPWIGQELGNTISGIGALYLLTMGIVAYRKGSRQAGFFLLAWTAFLVGVVMFVLKDEGVIAYTTATVYAMPIGSAIEGVLLSFGLADRINILRREKERSQAEALASSLENERIIREQNVMLEEKVQERTHALQESNDHLKRTQTQLVNAEKMASLGQLTAGIAHEINNPVNFITSNIPPLRRNLGEVLEVLDDYRKAGTTVDAEALKAAAEKERTLGLGESILELGEILGSIQEGADRTAEIVRGLRNFSRLDEDDLKPADLNDCLRSTVTILGPQFRDQVVLDMQLGTIPRVECYAGKLNQVFMNMLNNAAQAVKTKHPAGLGRVTVSTEQVADQVIVTIRDNGVGMSDEVMARIYDPFFTTKDVGEGTGLGLSIAYSIVEKHHGRLEVDSVAGEGTVFRVVLPIDQPRAIDLNAQRA
jgi:two-component system NtrC family sensor kinase